MSERHERRLWRIDLNAVEAYDADGERLTVTEVIGELDGPLVVRVAPREHELNLMNERTR